MLIVNLYVYIFVLHPEKINETMLEDRKYSCNHSIDFYIILPKYLLVRAD